MKQQIDNLIANILFTEEGLFLPEIGTLVLLRHPAKLLSKRVLQQPYRELQLTAHDERFESLPSHIARIAKVSEERASDIYAEWLSQSLHNGVLMINGVCSIEGEEVRTDEKFEKIANPQGRKTKKIKPRKKSFVSTLLTALLIVICSGLGYVYYTGETINPILSKLDINSIAAYFKPTVKVKPTVEVEAPMADTTLIVEIEPMDTTAVTVRDTIPAAPQQVEEQTTTDSVFVEIATTEKVVVPKAQKTQRAHSYSHVQRGYSYAVWGVYTKLSNAKEAKTWLDKKYPKLAVSIYRYDGRYMVAIYKSKSRNACASKVKKWKSQYRSFKSVWVYTR